MSKRFRIAFSFAGEKRHFVAEVAEILAKRFGEDHILYDKFHEAEFARSNLAFHLSNLYFEEADLVVSVLSADYDKKEWCGLEWNAIYGRIKNRQVDEVMLTRFDRVEGEGLFGLAGFVDLDDKTPAEAAKLILQRLARNEGHPKDFYTRDTSAGPDWPAVAPSVAELGVVDTPRYTFSLRVLVTNAVTFLKSHILGIILVVVFCSVVASFIYSLLQSPDPSQKNSESSSLHGKVAGDFLVHRMQSHERVYLYVLPKEMMAKVAGLTDMQGAILVDQIYGGRWIRISASVAEVYGHDSDKNGVPTKFAYLVFRPDGITTRVFLDDSEVARAAALNRGDRVTVEAQFKQLDRNGPDFEHGVFVTSDQEAK